MIQQSIQTNTEGYLRELSGIQYMRALALIYSHRVSGFKETQIEFDPIQKRNLNPKRQQKTRLSVDRPVDRSMPRSTALVDRAQLRAACFQSVDRAGRPLSATVDRAVDRANLVHVVHAGRPGRSTGLLHRSTGRPTESTIWPALMRRFSLLDFRSLC